MIANSNEQQQLQYQLVFVSIFVVGAMANFVLRTNDWVTNMIPESTRPASKLSQTIVNAITARTQSSQIQSYR